MDGPHILIRIASLLAAALTAMILVRPAPTSANPLGGIAAVTGGDSHTCTVTTAGGVKCWGGMFGASPVDVVGLEDDVVSVTAGWGHTCALTTADGVKCWGRNSEGQLGDGTTTGRTTPVDVLMEPYGSPLSDVASVAAGWTHTCAVTTTGGVKCWGRNSEGQLGDGTTTNRAIPTDVCQDYGEATEQCTEVLSDIAAVSASRLQHTCAVTTSGGVKCWGRNEFGELGDGTMGDGDIYGRPYDNIRTTPVDVLTEPDGPPLGGVKAVVTSNMATCAITTADGVKCWGNNGGGRLGNGTEANSAIPVDVLTEPDGPPLSGVTAAAAGSSHTCVLTTMGGVECWGSGGFGVLGNGRGPPYVSAFPTDVMGLGSGVAAIGAGFHHTCAVTAAGGVKCWGRNGSGQLGNGSEAPRVVPVPTDVLGPDAKPRRLRGDVDCDQSVTSVDALLLLQFDAAITDSMPCADMADVNRDGRFGAVDAALILQIHAGLIGRCPVDQDQSSQDLIAALVLDGNRTRFAEEESITLHLSITNCSDGPVTRGYSSSHHYDFVVRDADGQEVWRWSHDMLFLQILTSQTFQPGQTVIYTEVWNQETNDGEQVAPGSYEVLGYDAACRRDMLDQCDLIDSVVIDIVP